MKIKEIEEIIVDICDGTYDGDVIFTDDAAKEIYKLHLEDKLHTYIILALEFSKGFKTQVNIIDEILTKGKELQQELKSLEE